MNNGYSIKHDITPYPGETTDLLRWAAIDGGEVIGELYVDMERHIIMNVEVDADRRGEGIATALYDAAAAELDDLMHAPEEACTPEGLAFSRYVGGARAEDMEELAEAHEHMAALA